MNIEGHIVTGTLIAAGVGWWQSPGAGVLVWTGSALIDVDHYLWYAIRFRDWSLRRAQEFFEAKKANDYYCLCIFHTLEAIALYIACLWMSGPLFWLAVGCLTHIVLDVGQSIWDRGLLLRKWSLIHAILYWKNGRFRR